jgi:flagellar biosynthetic protein FliP
MKKKVCIIFVLILLCVVFMGQIAQAAPASTTIPVPKISLSVDNASSPSDYVDNIKIVIMMTVLTLLPSIVIMTTSFVRIVVVFGFLKSAMGTQNAPPSQVIIGLSLFLTFFIMMPTVTTINNNAVQPYINKTITQSQAITSGEKPLKDFMLRQTRQKDLLLFMNEAKEDPKTPTVKIPMHVVIHNRFFNIYTFYNNRFCGCQYFDVNGYVYGTTFHDFATIQTAFICYGRWLVYACKIANFKFFVR